MSALRRSRTACAAALLLAAGAGRAATPLPDAARLLAECDLFARAPAAFRVRLTVAAPAAAAAGLTAELYRAGEERALLRLLDPEEAGRMFLLRGDEAWLLAPGAANPVRVAGATPVAGAPLAALAGASLARDFRVAGATVASGIATIELAAASTRAPAPRARIAVDVARRLPLRADLLGADGRTLRQLRFAAWRDERRALPARLLVEDFARGTAVVEIRFGEFTPLELPDEFFAPGADGAAARAAVFARR